MLLELEKYKKKVFWSKFWAEMNIELELKKMIRQIIIDIKDGRQNIEFAHEIAKTALSSNVPITWASRLSRLNMDNFDRYPNLYLDIFIDILNTLPYDILPRWQDPKKYAQNVFLKIDNYFPGVKQIEFEEYMWILFPNRKKIRWSKRLCRYLKGHNMPFTLIFVQMLFGFNRLDLNLIKIFADDPITKHLLTKINLINVQIQEKKRLQDLTKEVKIAN